MFTHFERQKKNCETGFEFARDGKIPISNNV